MSESLTDLIDLAMSQEQVTSGRALGDVAQRRGLALTHTQINHIKAGTYKSRPKRPTLDAIATLARVPRERAYAAAGVPMPGPSFAAELPPDVDLLEPHQRAAVIGVVRSFLIDQKERRDVPPITRAADDRQQDYALAARPGAPEPTEADVLGTSGEESQETLEDRAGPGVVRYEQDDDSA